MTVNDRSRLDLHRRLEAVLGTEEAATLMAHLPPVTWQDVATKDDVRVLGVELRAEMADLRSELREEIGGLRLEMREEVGGLRLEMERGFTRQTKWMAGLMSGWAAITLAAIGLFV
jgi:hypothetical protein